MNLSFEILAQKHPFINLVEYLFAMSPLTIQLQSERSYSSQARECADLSDILIQLNAKINLNQRRHLSTVHAEHINTCMHARMSAHTGTDKHTNAGVQVGGPRWVKSLAQAVTKQQVELCHMKKQIGHVQSWWSSQDWVALGGAEYYKCVCITLSNSCHLISLCEYVYVPVTPASPAISGVQL